MSPKDVELVKLDYDILKKFMEGMNRFMDDADTMQDDIEKLAFVTAMMMALITNMANTLKGESILPEIRIRGREKLQ